MYPEYRQRYQDQLVRVTILSVTTTVAWVIGTIGSQWAVAGVSRHDEKQAQASSEQVDPVLVELVRVIAGRLIQKDLTTTSLPESLLPMVTALTEHHWREPDPESALKLIPKPAGAPLDFWSLRKAVFLTVPQQEVRPADLHEWLLNILPNVHGLGYGPVTDLAALAVLALDTSHHLAAGSSPEVAVVLDNGKEVAAYHLDAAQTSDTGYQSALQAAKQNLKTVHRFFANEV
ncbi:hypothetical protein HWN39_01535 [Lactobacillus rhamnosus]|uniref:Uncharacterized protein n=1 Tax=Lacticaseibacillus rhamnosus TaxID=47715 RepID=A0A7Y7UHC0_LACRH|nr:hypothetical protein [Lacticaseibacillus rhamnosus]NVO87177.1 hypothetical protein [Lacticaseibacillus rhamnosus]